MKTVQVVTSRIYCHTTSHLGRTPLLFGLVLNGLEILKLISGSFPRQGLEFWMNSFKMVFPYSSGCTMNHWEMGRKF